MAGTHESSTRSNRLLPITWASHQSVLNISLRHKSTIAPQKRKQPSIPLREPISDSATASTKTTTQSEISGAPTSPPAPNRPQIAPQPMARRLRPEQPLEAPSPVPSTPTPHGHPPSTSNPTPFSASSLNAFAVSTLSAQAHPSRPAPRIHDGRLPEGYKAAARKVTLAMVAMPIAIVTSWVLWERVVMGQERKRLVRGTEEEGVE